MAMITIKTTTEYEWHVMRAEMIDAVVAKKAIIKDSSNASLTITRNGFDVLLIRPKVKT